MALQYTGSTFNEFHDLKRPPMLRAMVMFAAGYCYAKYGKQIILTCVLRLKDTGVHGYGRATDGDNDALTPEEKQDVADYTNAHFAYDPERPTLLACVYHTATGARKAELEAQGYKVGGDHWHFQVHPNTQWRE